MQLSSTAGQTPFPAMGIYCTTKWALEGFYETLGVEVAPFGIRTTIVEPGSVRNEFLASASWAPAMPEYAEGPAGFIRTLMATLPQAALAGDPAKVADAMIAAAESDEPPRRLLLGSDAYGQVQPAMAGRLAEIEAQRDACGRTDADDYVPPPAGVTAPGELRSRRSAARAGLAQPAPGRLASVCKVLAMDDTCPVCKTAEIVCGKWTLLLIRDLSEGRSRFCELERSLQGISPRTLSLRLRALEEEGIVERDTYAEVPPRVEYVLTEKGRALLPIIDDMRKYGSRWLGADCADLAPAGAAVDAAAA